MAEVNITNPADLAKAVDGKSDADINKALEGQFEATCKQVFDGMAKRFLPEKAGTENAVIQYDVAAPDGVHTFQLKVAGGKCEVAKGATGTPRVTLALSFPDRIPGSATSQAIVADNRPTPRIRGVRVTSWIWFNRTVTSLSWSGDQDSPIFRASSPA